MRDDLAPAVWHKSTYSSNQGECVEVAGLSSGLVVRDSKNRNGAVLSFTAAQWSAFVAGVGAGEFG
jgi:Domain of unknown function (DUF397)